MSEKGQELRATYSYRVGGCWGQADPTSNHFTCKLLHKIRNPTGLGTQACPVDIYIWLLLSLPHNPVFSAKSIRLAWGMEGKNIPRLHKAEEKPAYASRQWSTFKTA